MNQLKNELSPYLIGHASNPVNWHPWSEFPFSIARKQNKPIFLSIGYSACHWCHVMERESFINDKIAKILNEHFVAIKVDREERPDIDKIYMDALLSMTGSGGWPMSMFITPEGKPFYGGTYYPPQSRYGLPGFSEILLSVIHAWNDNKADLIDQASRITNHLNHSLNDATQGLSDSKLAFEIISHKFMENYDSIYGGWGVRPKFPHSLALDLLIFQNKNINNEIGHQITHTLDQMANGGFHDLLRGGFHRYSTDQYWLVPHFEKMLYDNALLAKTYLYAGSKGYNNSFLEISKTTLDFIKSELLDPSGGFWSSLDADSDGEEGTYYLWSYEELINCFDDANWNKFTQSFDITETGNFEGKIILRKSDKNNDHIDLQILRTIQDERIRPLADNKVLLDWNALTLSAFSMAGKYFTNYEYINIAEKNAEFIVSQMYISGRLYHTWKNGQHKQKAFLSDYAFLINALYDLFLTNLDIKWFNHANTLLEEMVNLFWSEDQFFDTGLDQNDLIMRPQTIEDNVVPSGWSAAIQAIQKYSFFNGNLKYSEIINKSFSYLKSKILKYPIAHPNWISVMITSEQLNDYVVLIKHPEDIINAQNMEAMCKSLLPPNVIFVSLPESINNFEKVEFLKDKNTVNSLSTIYICTNGVCSKPINQIDTLEKILFTNFISKE